METKVFFLCLFSQVLQVESFSTNERSNLPYTLSSEMETLIELPKFPSHPMFGETSMPFSQIEEDQLLPGNILALLDGRAIISYSLDGQIKHVISQHDNPYLQPNDALPEDMVVIDRDYMTFGGFIQSTTTTIDNQVNSSYIYITLKYAHCIKAVDRLNTSLIHISGDCHLANRASYEDRSQDVTSISNATFFGPDGMSPLNKRGTEVRSFYVVEKFAAVVSLVDLDANLVTCYKPITEATTYYTPRHITVTERNTMLISAGLGLYEADTDGFIQWIINPAKYSHRKVNPDGPFGDARGSRTNMLIRVPDTDVYLFADSFFMSIRAVDMSESRVYTLCYHGDTKLFTMPHNYTVPICSLDNPTSVMLNANKSALLVGMNNVVVQFELMRDSGSQNSSDPPIENFNLTQLRGIEDIQTTVDYILRPRKFDAEGLHTKPGTLCPYYYVSSERTSVSCDRSVSSLFKGSAVTILYSLCVNSGDASYLNNTSPESQCIAALTALYSRFDVEVKRGSGVCVNIYFKCSSFSILTEGKHRKLTCDAAIPPQLILQASCEAFILEAGIIVVCSLLLLSVLSALTIRKVRQRAAQKKDTDADALQLVTLSNSGSTTTISQVIH